MNQRVHFDLARGVRQGDLSGGAYWLVDMPEVPRVGDAVMLRWQAEFFSFHVHAVTWNPHGDEDSDGAFVYVTLR
jgi:hypothetical protein